MSKTLGYRRIHRLGLGAQLAHLRALNLAGANGSIKGGKLSFQCEVQPTALSRTYRIELVYELGGSPKVFVLDPNLVEVSAAQGRPPHLYSCNHPVQLCLYLPAAGDWRSDQYVSLSIIPWAVEWLFFYEMWQATGEWLGGGIHPAPNKKKSESKLRGVK